MVEEILCTPILLADSFFRLPILDMFSEYSLLTRGSFSSSLFSLPLFICVSYFSRGVSLEFSLA